MMLHPGVSRKALVGPLQSDPDPRRQTVEIEESGQGQASGQARSPKDSVGGGVAEERSEAGGPRAPSGFPASTDVHFHHDAATKETETTERRGKGQS